MRLSLAFGSTSVHPAAAATSLSVAFPLPRLLLIRLLVLLHVIWLFCRCIATPLSFSLCLTLSNSLSIRSYLFACVCVAVRSGIFMTLVIKFNCCTFGARAHGASLGCGRGDITLFPHTPTLRLSTTPASPANLLAMRAHFQSRSQHTQVPAYVCCSAFRCLSYPVLIKGTQRVLHSHANITGRHLWDWLCVRFENESKCPKRKQLLNFNGYNLVVLCRI